MFSTMNGWPNSRDKPSATMRPIASLVPPAGNGTMIFTGLLGHASSADAGPATKSAAKAPSRERRIMACLLLESRESADARRVQQPARVAEREGHEALAALVELGHRHVVRAQGARVAAALIGLDGLEHVDVAFVREGLLEVEVAAADVAEMDHEDAAGRCELLDHRDHGLARLLEHLRDRALAEVEAVVAAVAESEELAQPVGRAHHVLDAVQAAHRIRRVMRMAREAHAGLVGRRHQAFDEELDRIPARLFGDLRH